MFGVIVDHWAGCDDYSYCQIIDRLLQFARPARTWKWVEYAVRSIGNYKAMSGFVLLSAFQDAATPSLATSFAGLQMRPTCHEVFWQHFGQI